MKRGTINILIGISLAFTLGYLYFLIDNMIKLNVVFNFEMIGHIFEFNSGGLKNLAINIMLPHIVCVFFALILNLLIAFIPDRNLTLATAILYAVAIILLPRYFIFIVIQMILCFIAFNELNKNF